LTVCAFLTDTAETVNTQTKTAWLTPLLGVVLTAFVGLIGVYFKYVYSQRAIDIQIYVADQANMSPVQDARVTLNDGNETRIKATEKDGRASFILSDYRQRTLPVIVTAANYADMRLEVETDPKNRNLAYSALLVNRKAPQQSSNATNNVAGPPLSVGDGGGDGCWSPSLGHQISSVAFSPNSRWLVSGTYDNKIIVWDVLTCQMAIQPLDSGTGAIQGLAFDHRGQWLASAGFNNTATKIWSLAADQKPLEVPEPRALPGESGATFSVAFWPNGFCWSGEDAKIEVWDLVNTPLILEVPGSTSPINAVAISPDGTRLASGTNDGAVQLWDLTARKVIYTMKHNGVVASVALARMERN
jgi:WD40 repeat protein